MDDKEAMCKCGHEKKYHAIPERHVLKTSFCTKSGCDCTQFVEAESEK